MKTRMRILTFSIAFFYLFVQAVSYSFAQDSIKPRNVILFIGDGMGMAHIYAAYTMNRGYLNMMRCPYTGFSMTRSATSYITDSGAGATAISCGKKTYNHAIGVDVDSIPCKTILEYAEENGLSTGLVSTSAITHATPAAFIAHEKSRSLYEAIASDFLKTDIEVIIGGGGQYFTMRSDSVDLITRLRNNGYKVELYPPFIGKIPGDKIAVFTAPGHNLRASKGRGSMLPDATVQAIELLHKNEKGFFLMVEGSQIDWGSHNNDINYVVEELIDMDKAVGKALEFAKQDGNTLVIITADHETGGLVILDGNITNGTVDVKFNTTGHTCLMVPVFAYGPGAEHFSGIYENTSIFSKMMYLLNFTDVCVSLTHSD